MITCYFRQWYKTVCDRLQTSGEITDLEINFNKQIDDKGRVSILIGNRNMAVDIQECYRKKCNKTSEGFRNTGNRLYSNKKLDDATSAYTKSIAYAENNSKELALSYANRSAVLFVVKEFLICENDIQLAFKNSYPQYLQFKLYERLGKCHMELDCHEKALEAFKKCISSLSECALDTQKRNQRAHRVFELIKMCQHVDNILQNDLPVFHNKKYELIPPIIGDSLKNKTFPCATQSFGVINETDKGRHAIAMKDISAGEIIIVEKAFTSICLPSAYSTHCYNCLSRFKIAYPCRNCVTVHYCSTECENSCWKIFHQYECSYLDLLIQEDVGLGHLAYKMVVLVGLEDVSNFETREKSLTIPDNSMFGVNELGIFEPSDYLCLYSLVGNSEMRKSADLFRRTLVAIYLSKILVKKRFFDQCESVETYQTLVAAHLLKQIQMLPCNAHEISELQLDGHQVVNAELKEIGSAAFTTLSLLNHSCDPSVVRHCYGDTCVLRAVKHINKGEPIVDNYGFIYAVEDKVSRQKHLSEQYYFACNCIPCTEEWPLYNDLSETPPSFVCSKCSNVISKNYEKSCSKCNYLDHEITGFNKLHNEFQNCMENILDTGKSEEKLPTLLQYLNLVSQKAVLPVVHLNNCQEIVKLCLSMEGNFAKLK